jgi:hypothetical protein
MESPIFGFDDVLVHISLSLSLSLSLTLTPLRNAPALECSAVVTQQGPSEQTAVWMQQLDAQLGHGLQLEKVCHSCYVAAVMVLEHFDFSGTGTGTATKKKAKETLASRPN